MTSLKQLERERARLLKEREKQQTNLRATQQKQDLRREIFMLKHGKKIDSVKRIGKSTQKFIGKTQKWAEKRQGATSPRRTKQTNYFKDSGSIW